MVRFKIVITPSFLKIKSPGLTFCFLMRWHSYMFKFDLSVSNKIIEILSYHKEHIYIDWRAVPCRKGFLFRIYLDNADCNIWDRDKLDAISPKGSETGPPLSNIHSLHKIHPEFKSCNYAALQKYIYALHVTPANRSKHVCSSRVWCLHERIWPAEVSVLSGELEICSHHTLVFPAIPVSLRKQESKSLSIRFTFCIHYCSPMRRETYGILFDHSRLALCILIKS